MRILTVIMEIDNGWLSGSCGTILILEVGIRILCGWSFGACIIGRIIPRGLWRVRVLWLISFCSVPKRLKYTKNLITILDFWIKSEIK